MSWGFIKNWNGEQRTNYLLEMKANWNTLSVRALRRAERAELVHNRSWGFGTPVIYSPLCEHTSERFNQGGSIGRD